MVIESKVSDKFIVLIGEYQQTITNKHVSMKEVAEQSSLSEEEVLDIERELEQMGLMKLKFDDKGEFKNSRITEDGIKIVQRLNFADRLLIDISRYLRKGIYKVPENEIEIQNVLEFLLTVLEYNFERSLESVPTVTKYTIPDFTFEDNILALELKYCSSKTKEKDIIDEVNADIASYLSKFKIIVFIIYDISTIRDIDKFEKGFEKINENIFVKVIKH